MSLITSSSACDSRFFFFRPASEVGLSVDGSPLLAADCRPFECTAPAVEVDDSPFRQDNCASGSCPPVPLACMLRKAFKTSGLLLKRTDERRWGVGIAAAERPVIPAADAPLSPAPSAAEPRLFFRGGGEAPPVSVSEVEEAEARVSSPAMSESRRPSGSISACFRTLRTRSLTALVIVCQRTAASPLRTSVRDDVNQKRRNNLELAAIGDAMKQQ